MSASPVVLDTCVLIAWAKQRDVHHSDALDVLAEAEDFVIHEITLAEYLAGPAQLGQDVAAIASQVLADLHARVADPAQLSRDQCFAAHLATVRAQTRLKMPDAIVLATALAIGGKVSTFDGALHDAAEGRGVLYIVPAMKTKVTACSDAVPDVGDVHTTVGVSGLPKVAPVKADSDLHHGRRAG